MKLVINKCFGGFSLSPQAVSLIRTKLEATFQQQDIDELLEFDGRRVPRNLPEVVEAVESLGVEANGRCADLRVIEIPDNIQWQVVEYDGNEHVAEVHRRWQ